MLRAMSTILVDQLRDMGNAMQVHKGEWQERFLATEREMQQSFIDQIKSMQERLTRESQNVHMAFLEGLINRNPSQPGYQTPTQKQYSRRPSFYDLAVALPTLNPEYSIYRQLP